jgi:hypothetical protein
MRVRIETPEPSMNKDITQHSDAVLGVFAILVGGLALWLCRDLSMGTTIRMGAGYFPTLIASLLVAIGVILVGKSFLVPEALEAWAWFPLAATLGSLVIFALSLERLGLAVSVLLLMGVSSLAIPGHRWKEIAALAVGASVAAWLLFGKLLGIPLKFWPF